MKTKCSTRPLRPPPPGGTARPGAFRQVIREEPARHRWPDAGRRVFPSGDSRVSGGPLSHGTSGNSRWGSPGVREDVLGDVARGLEADEGGPEALVGLPSPWDADDVADLLGSADDELLLVVVPFEELQKRDEDIEVRKPRPPVLVRTHDLPSPVDGFALMDPRTHDPRRRRSPPALSRSRNRVLQPILSPTRIRRRRARRPAAGFRGSRRCLRIPGSMPPGNPRPGPVSKRSGHRDLVAAPDSIASSRERI